MIVMGLTFVCLFGLFGLTFVWFDVYRSGTSLSIRLSDTVVRYTHTTYYLLSCFIMISRATRRVHFYLLADCVSLRLNTANSYFNAELDDFICHSDSYSIIIISNNYLDF